MCENQFQKNILLFGPVTARGIGDAGQYYASSKMLNDYFPKDKVTIMCPDANDSKVFTGYKLKANLVDSGNIHFLSLGGAINVQKFYTSITQSKSTTKYSPMKVLRKPLKRLIMNNYHKLPPFTWPDETLALLRIKYSSFNGGIFGGHTITEGIINYLVKYGVFKKIVKGPKIVSPISLSNLGLRNIPEKNRKKLLQKLKKSLEEFDRVYTRGKYTYNVLTEDLGLGNIEMALDTGFGLKNYVRKKESKIITIIPRNEYFKVYERKDLEQIYYSLINKVIKEYRNKGYVIIISNQAMNTFSLEGLELNKDDSGIKVIIPKSIKESFDLYASSDMVITSYMHGGITALCSGTPSLFIMPELDVKTLDVLTSIGLELEDYFVDMFNPQGLEYERTKEKIAKILNNPVKSSMIIKKKIDYKYSTIYNPTKYLKELLNS